MMTNKEMIDELKVVYRLNHKISGDYSFCLDLINTLDRLTYCKDCKYCVTISANDELGCIYYDDDVYRVKLNDFCSRGAKK